VMWFNGNMTYPGWRAALPVFGTMAIIAAGPAAWINRQCLSLSSVTYIGRISYPLYLWSWPFIVFTDVMGTEDWQRLKYEKLGALAVAALLAILTYHFIEVPVRRRRAARTLRPLVAA